MHRLHGNRLHGKVVKPRLRQVCGSGSTPVGGRRPQLDDDSVLNLDDVACDKGQNVADAEQLALEQQHDKSLAMCFSLAKRGKAGYFIHAGILYRKEKILGHEIEQLCLPRTRRSQAIRLAHQGYGCLLYTSPSPRDGLLSRMPSSA